MLTNTAIRNASPAQAHTPLRWRRTISGSLTDGGQVVAAQIPLQRQRKTVSLGVYPDVSLKDARDRRDDARKLLADSVDPSENRKALKSARADRAENSFEVVTREWFAKYSADWADNHKGRIMRRFERNVFPWIGGRPIAEITAPELLAVVRRIEARGVLETAHRTLATCGQVYRYAVATGRAERNPSLDLRGALPPVNGEHFAAITDPKRVGELLRAWRLQGTLTAGPCAAPFYSCARRTAMEHWRRST